MAQIKGPRRKLIKPKSSSPRRKKTRITIDLPSEEHKRLKAIAAIRGTTLQDLIIDCIDEKMHQPNAKTIEVIRKAERGEGLTHCKNFDDFIKKIGLD